MDEGDELRSDDPTGAMFRQILRFPSGGPHPVRRCFESSRPHFRRKSPQLKGKAFELVEDVISYEGRTPRG